MVLGSPQAHCLLFSIVQFKCWNIGELHHWGIKFLEYPKLFSFWTSWATFQPLTPTFGRIYNWLSALSLFFFYHWYPTKHPSISPCCLNNFEVYLQLEMALTQVCLSWREISRTEFPRSLLGQAWSIIDQTQLNTDGCSAAHRCVVSWNQPSTWVLTPIIFFYFAYIFGIHKGSLGFLHHGPLMQALLKLKGLRRIQKWYRPLKSWKGSHSNSKLIELQLRIGYEPLPY